MHARTLALALGGITALLSGVADAHFNLLQPSPASTRLDGGKGAPPCGEGDASRVVTIVQGGHPLTVKLEEYLSHPGHYRIALSVNSRAELPPDPDVVTKNGRSVSAAIQKPPRIPVLADGQFVHARLPNKQEWQTAVTLPNITCDRCTLQVVEFMAEQDLTGGDGYFHHHCADLQITADLTLGPPDPAWPRPSQ